MVDDCRGAVGRREPALGDKSLRVGELGRGEMKGVGSDGDVCLEICGAVLGRFFFLFFFGTKPLLKGEVS